MLEHVFVVFNRLLGRRETPERMARSGFDRRVHVDRREALDLDYLQGAPERRKGERRIRARERRSGWQRVGRWNSTAAMDAGLECNLAEGEKIFFL